MILLKSGFWIDSSIPDSCIVGTLGFLLYEANEKRRSTCIRTTSFLSLTMALRSLEIIGSSWTLSDHLIDVEK